MTLKEIENRKARDARKYELALQIRQMLDEARKQYNKEGGDWDGEDLDSEISELVFSE